MDFKIDIGSVSKIKEEMVNLAEEIQVATEAVGAILEELQQESFGRFVEALKVATDALIDFAAALVKALFSALEVIGNILKRLVQKDEEGGNSLASSGIATR